MPSAGQVTFTITSDDAFILGVGNGATRVSGTLTNTPAATAFKNYAVMGGVNQRSAPAPNTITVNFPTAGAYPYELDYAKGGDNKMTLTMQATAAPIPAPVLLTLTPASAPSITAGQVEQLTLTATDSSGVVLAYLPVTVNVTGVNAQTRLLTTNGAGQVNFAYVGEQFLTGTDTVQAAVRVSGADTFSNAVVITWNNGTNAAPVVSAGTPQTVILPAPAILSGAVTDDGLPAASTVSVTWTKVSGPGTVTFDNAIQANTSAAFSVAGAYVLQLSATDGTLTTNSTVAITTINNPNWSSGWIAAPLDKSTVTQPVPVTLIPGITLTSGTLTYWPANSPQSVVTLSASTTGTGQISTFDPTLLNNGKYFIVLSATNNVGATMTSQVYVTVAGDYKPGRVTATVTDLKVPATGLPITISRTYDSLTRGTSMDFGYGWKLGIQVQMEVSPTADVTFTINGQRRTFYFTPPANQIFTYWYTSQYTAEPGLYGSLTAPYDNCGGTPGAQIPLQRVGNVFQCAINNAGAGYQPTTYQYTDAYGRVYTIGSDGNLQSLKDLGSNTLTVTPAGITSSTGLSVPFVRDTQGRITKITDPLGNAYNYAYDTNGNLGTLTLPPNPPVTQLPVTYTYDTTHLLTSEQNPRGNSGSTSYYPNGTLQSITDAAGQRTSYVYNTATNTTTVTNPDAGITTIIADSYGMPLSVTDPLGRKTMHTYDANHNLQSTTDGLGHTTTYGYDSNGNTASVTYPRTPTSTNTTSLMTYNQYGRQTSRTDELGNVQTAYYDSRFNPTGLYDMLNGTVTPLVTLSFNPNGTLQSTAMGYDLVALPNKATKYLYDQYGNKTSQADPLGRQTLYTYDTMGRLLTTTSPLPLPTTPPSSATTTNQYDPLGRLLKVTAPIGSTTSYTYDGNGNRLTLSDANNHTKSYQYDALNRVTQITYPTLPVTSSTFTYDFRGNVINSTDPSGNVTHNEYDLAGQLTAVTLGYGTTNASRRTIAYDAAGRKIGDTDARGNTTSYNYDEAGRMTSVLDPVGHLTNYSFDAAGNGISVTDSAGHTTQQQYDQRRRPFKTTYSDSTYDVRTFDGANRILTITDQAGAIVRYAYDDAEQLLNVVQANSPDPQHNTTSYGYDQHGNLQTATDGNSHTTTSLFDFLDRAMSQTLPAGGPASARGYDPSGNLVTAADYNGKTTAFAYDGFNRLLSKDPDPSLSEARVSFTYTSTGRRATMLDASGVTNYLYDHQDRLTTKATPQGTLTYTYDAAGNLSSIASSNTNGVSLSYAWDALNRLESVLDNRLPVGKNTTSYAYDAAGNLATTMYPNGIQSTLTYDALNRPIGLSIAKTSQLASYSYGLGAAGNRLSVAEMSGRQVNYRYDGLYRLTNETISSDPQNKNGALGYTLDPVGNRTARASTLLAQAAASYSYDANDRLATETYDANGNALISQGNTYAYSFDNRLKSVNNGSITIVYDGDGNRVSKTVGGVTTRYLVDDLNPTGYPQVLEEVAGSGATRVYSYGLARISQNQVIAGAWAPSFYVYDGSDSVRLLTDGAVTVTDSYDYDAFGNVINSTGSTPNNYLYGGEELDRDLGLYYLRARYYNPATGRFMSMDPANGDVMDPLSQHKYAYAAGNPVNLKDPSGKGFEEVGQLLSRITPSALVIATLQTAAAACFAGTVVPVLGMAVITASGGEVYDVQTPFPCLVTFMARPRARPDLRPRTAPAPTQTMNGCTPQELASRYAVQLAAEAASTAFGPCGCPKLRANTKIVLIEAFIAARLNVMACYSDGGNQTHWDQVDGLDINLARCVATAQACPN